LPTVTVPEGRRLHLQDGILLTRGAFERSDRRVDVRICEYVHEAHWGGRIPGNSGARTAGALTSGDLPASPPSTMSGARTVPFVSLLCDSGHTPVVRLAVASHLSVADAYSIIPTILNSPGFSSGLFLFSRRTRPSDASQPHFAGITPSRL
jgi:hypothetical protein